MSDEEYFENLVSSSLDGALTDAEKEKLSAHLEKCASCAALKRDLESMRAMLKSDAESVEYPENLHNDIMERVRQDGRLRVVQPEKPVRHMPVLTMVAVAAVVLVMVLGGGIGQMFSMVGGGSGSDNGSVSADARTAEGRSAEPPQDAGTDALNGSEYSDTEDSAYTSGADASAVKPGDYINGGDESSNYAMARDMDGGGGTSNGGAEYDISTALQSPAPDPGEGFEDYAESGSGASGFTGNDDSISTYPALEDSSNESAVTKGSEKAHESKSTEHVISLPESLKGMGAAHCYLAQGYGAPPDVKGELILNENGVSYFVLNNGTGAIEETLAIVEQAGYSVEEYEDVGLVINSKADKWILILREL